MRFNSDTLGLSPTGVLLLRDLIHEKAGVFYEDSRCNVLMDKLAPLVVERGFDSFLDYYYLLRYDTDASDEWERVLDALAVPETYFWREFDQVRAVVDVIVPALVRNGHTVRIWSVPCSTGEEPLSIAMALDAEGWFARARIELCASDASREAIKAARIGRYRERSFRALPAEMRERYFTRDSSGWQVDPALQSRIRFSTVNVMDREEAGRFATSQIIFCRNLLIYFSQSALARVAQTFADFMPVPGYLCLGASESLIRHTTRFELQEVGGAYVYVKR